MNDYSALPNQVVAEVLLAAASQLNGNTPPTSFDGGAGARQTLKECIDELASRAKLNLVNANDAYFQPIIAILSGVSADAKLGEIAIALKGVKLPQAKTAPVPKAGVINNPFGKK